MSKISKGNLTDDNLIKKWSENVFKGNLILQISWTEEFRQGNVFGWWAHDKLQYKNILNDKL